jgi:hypothetical protein
METKKWYLSGKEAASYCNGAIFHEISKDNNEDKIHCTVSKLDETWLKYSLALYHYVKVQQLDDIYEIRR